jgi:hypothetical protein
MYLTCISLKKFPKSSVQFFFQLMDLLADVALLNDSLLCSESTTRPSSPTTPKQKTPKEFKTPERKSVYTHLKKVHVFSTTSHMLYKVGFNDDMKLFSSNMQYISTTNGEIVVRKRFTCVKGPIEKKQKCIICNKSAIRKKSGNQCQYPYYIFYSNDLKEQYDTVPLTKDAAEAYSSFSPSIISKTNVSS